MSAFVARVQAVEEDFDCYSLGGGRFGFEKALAVVIAVTHPRLGESSTVATYSLAGDLLADARDAEDVVVNDIANGCLGKRPDEWPGTPLSDEEFEQLESAILAVLPAAKASALDHDLAVRYRYRDCS